MHLRQLARTCLILFVGGVLVVPAVARAQKYMGVGKCKTCHDSEDMGQKVAKWKTTKHAKAYESLASDAAKKMKAEAPNDPGCLKCHVTAYGEPKTKLDAKFKENLGVQCESCHGPGESHVNARKKVVDVESKVADDEIVKKPTEKVCVGCHNKTSPSYKEFKFAEAFKLIAHPKKR